MTKDVSLEITIPHVEGCIKKVNQRFFILVSRNYYPSRGGMYEYKTEDLPDLRKSRNYYPSRGGMYAKYSDKYHEQFKESRNYYPSRGGMYELDVIFHMIDLTSLEITIPHVEGCMRKK